MKVKNLIAYALVGASVMGAVVPAYAYTNSTESYETAEISANVEKEACTVYAEVGSQFTVTIPKAITLSGETKSGEYTVSCIGDIAGDEYVLVKPDASFEMSQAGKNKVTATITQEKTMFRGYNYNIGLADTEANMGDGADVASDEIAGSISAQDLTAGAWNGTFNFKIALEQDATN